MDRSNGGLSRRRYKDNSVDEVPFYEENNHNELERLEPNKRPRAIRKRREECCVSFLWACFLSGAVVGVIMVLKKSSAKNYPINWYGRGTGWLGQSYPEAVEFCNAKTPGFRPCTYNNICPNGVGSEPTDGFRNGGGNGIWVPTGDKDNNWVRVSEGPGKSCVADQPDWGMRKEGNKEYTRFVACCSATSKKMLKMGTGTDLVTKEASAALKLAKMKTANEKSASAAISTRINWYGRGTGWLGQSYPEAVEFCNAKTPGFRPCLYDTICPNGIDSEPTNGYRNGGKNGIWIPTGDKANSWVKVSEQPGKSCITSEPSWGLRKEGNKEYTSVVACCSATSKAGAGTDKKELANSQQAAVKTADAKPHISQPSDAKLTNSHLANAQRENSNPASAAITSSINWYGRGTGWLGQSYPEAVEFCNAKTPGFRPCSYDTICPDGIDSEPTNGYRNGGKNGMWVPTGDKDNNWARVSDQPGKSCITDHPGWGLRKEGNEQYTRFVACCSAKSKTGTRDTISKTASATANLQQANAQPTDAKPNNL